MSRSIFSNTKLAVSSAVDTSVSIFATLDTTAKALDNVAQVGLIASEDWKKQAKFESNLKDKARAKIMENQEAIAAIETQMLTSMLGDYLPESKTSELFALPS